MAKIKESRSLPQPPPKPISRRNSNVEDSQGRNNIENGLYVHSSPPKVVSNDSGSSGSANIREYLRGGNISGLEEVVLDGNGNKLLSQSSTDPKVRAFLKTLPAYMSKIDLVHDAAERGNLRDLKTLLDRRKIARSKDSQGVGLMHKAVLSGNAELVEYLLENYPETAAITDPEKTGVAGGENWRSQSSLAEGASAYNYYDSPEPGGEQDRLEAVRAFGDIDEHADADNYAVDKVPEPSIYNAIDLNNQADATVLSGFHFTPINGTVNGYPTDRENDKPLGLQLKEFNEKLRSEMAVMVDDDFSNTNKFHREQTSINTWEEFNATDWDDEEHSYFLYGLSELFDENNIIEEEDIDDLSDGENDTETNPGDVKSQSLGAVDGAKVERQSVANANWEKIDLSSSVFSKKMPLPPTASGTRPTNSTYDIEKMFSSHLQRRKLSPVHNPRRASLGEPAFDVASPTTVNKLEPINVRSSFDHNASTGAIRKKSSFKKPGLKSDRLVSLEIDISPETSRNPFTKPSPRHVPQMSYQIVPNSANIRELVLRRNKIVNDLMLREERRESLVEELEEEEEVGESKPSSGTVKLPAIVNEARSSPELVSRPRTPTVMPRSATERLPMSKLIIDGHPVAAMKFKPGAFKVRKRLPIKKPTVSGSRTRSQPMVTSTRTQPMLTSTRSQPMVTSTRTRPMLTSTRSQPMVTSTRNQPMVTSTRSQSMVTSTRNQPTRLIVKKAKTSIFSNPTELQTCLGNFVFDNTKKKYPLDKNAGLQLKSSKVKIKSRKNSVRKDSLVAKQTLNSTCIIADTIKTPDTVKTANTSFPDDLPPVVQRFCRRLLWSTLAAAQADLGKVFKRAIHNQLAAEETLQVVYEHDVNYWAKQISERIYNNVLASTLSTPTSQTKIFPRKKLPQLDSGIHSGNPSASTQTSNVSSPRKVNVRDAQMSDIVAKLEELNVKLESGKPRYRYLVEQEKDEQSKLKVHQERWVTMNSLAQQK